MDDTVLIHQTLSGDDRAFEILVGRYQSAVFGWIRQTLPYAEQEEDLAQEVFIEAYFNLNTLREPYKFNGWLKQIARNVCISWLRHQKPSMSYEKLISDNQKREQIEIRSSQTMLTPEEQLLAHEAFADLESYIRYLSDSHQEIIRLYYFEGLTYQEISEMLDLSESAIKSRLHRAREQLRGVYDNEGTIN